MWSASASDASAISGKKIFQNQNVNSKNATQNEPSLTSCTSTSTMPPRDPRSNKNASTSTYNRTFSIVGASTHASGSSAASVLASSSAQAFLSSPFLPHSCNSPSSPSSLLFSEHAILMDVAHRLGTYYKQHQTHGTGSKPDTSSNVVTTGQGKGKVVENTPSLEPTMDTSSGRSHSGNNTAVRKEAELLLNFMSKKPASSSSITDTTSVGPCSSASRKVSHQDDLVFDTSNPNLSNRHKSCTISSSNTNTSSMCRSPDKCDSSGISPSFSFESRRQPKRQSIFDVKGGVSARVMNAKPHTTKKRKNDKTFDLICPSLSLSLSLQRHLPYTHSRTQSSVPLSTITMPTNSSTYNHTTCTPSQLFARPMEITCDIGLSDSYDLDAIASTLASNILQSFLTAIHWRIKAWMKSLSTVLSHRYQKEVHKNKISSNGKKKDVSKFQKQLQQTLKQSHEARVISALARAKDNIVVHDVRTTFSVLEQRHPHSDEEVAQEEKKEDVMMSSTAKKRRLNNRHGMSLDLDSNHPYDITHALMLETTCSVSTSTMEKMTISFATPGTLRGKFCNSSTKRTSPLQSLTFDLNTNTLAEAMEKQSRRVVSAATKEYMVGTPRHICTIHDTVHVQTEVKKRQMSIVSSSSEGENHGSKTTLIGYASGSDYEFELGGSGGKCPSLSSDSCHSYGMIEENSSDVDASIERENYTSYFVREKDTENVTDVAENKNSRTKTLQTKEVQEGSGGCALVTPIADEAHVALDVLTVLSDGMSGKSGSKKTRLPLEKVGMSGIQTRIGSLDDERKKLHLTFLNPRRVTPSADVEEKEQKQPLVVEVQTQSPSRDGNPPQDYSFASPVPTPSKVTNAGNCMISDVHRELLIPPSLVSPGGQSSSSYNLRRGSGLGQVSAPPMPALLDNSPTCTRAMHERCH